MSGSDSDDTIEAESASDEEHEEFVAKSSTRTAVLTRLVDGPAPAAEVAETKSASVSDAKTNSTSMSASSAENGAEKLREEGLVERLETDETTAYCLTAFGERVAFSLEQQNKL